MGYKSRYKYPKWRYPNYSPTYIRLIKSPGPPSTCGLCALTASGDGALLLGTMSGLWTLKPKVAPNKLETGLGTITAGIPYI